MSVARDSAVFASGMATGALGLAILLAVFGAGRAPDNRVHAAADREPPAPLESPDGIGLPIAGLRAKDIIDSFNQKRTGDQTHQAIDIMAPRGTPVLAVADGTIRKLFTSRAGGLTIYQFDPSETYCYYYAHLDGYAPGLLEGQLVHRGDIIGLVGSTGNASPAAPHLHFAVVRLESEKHWWEGTPLDPYPGLMRALEKKK